MVRRECLLVSDGPVINQNREEECICFGRQAKNQLKYFIYEIIIVLYSGLVYDECFLLQVYVFATASVLRYLQLPMGYCIQIRCKETDYQL